MGIFSSTTFRIECDVCLDEVTSDEPLESAVDASLVLDASGGEVIESPIGEGEEVVLCSFCSGGVRPEDRLAVEVGEIKAEALIAKVREARGIVEAIGLAARAKEGGA